MDVDDDGTSLHESIDEAIGVAMLESKAGDVIVVHEESCESDDESPECPCGPLMLVVGAKA